MNKINDNIYQIDEKRRLVRCYFNHWVVIDKDCVVLNNLDADFCKYLNQDKIAEIEELLLGEIDSPVAAAQGNGAH